MVRFFLFVLALFFISCGDSGSSDGDKPTTTTSKYKIVDPYIIGATLYVDKNKNGKFDTNEPTSTVSDNQGSVNFKAYTPKKGDILRVKTQGKHNGLTYDLNLSLVVNSDGGVVSPLSTIAESRELNNTQIVDILKTAGLTGITEADISKDPMSGVLGKTSIEDADLLKLQASLATYGLLSIINAANDMKPKDINGSEFVKNAIIKAATKQMVGFIKDSLSKKLLESIKTQVPTSPMHGVNIPAVKSDVVVKVSVAIMDKLIEVGKKKLKDLGGNKASIDNAIAHLKAETVKIDKMKIGQYAYGCENKDALKSFISHLPTQDLKDGVNCESEFFMLNDSYKPVKAQD